MNDALISRKALLEEISSLSVRVTGLRAGQGVLNEIMRHYKDSVLKCINEAPNSCVDWIPVTERTPEVGEYVLGSTESGEIMIVRYGWNYPCSTKMFFGVGWNVNTAKNIVAWIPLPEPYRTAEKGSN